VGLGNQIREVLGDWSSNVFSLLFDLQAALKQATEELQETQRVLAEAKARLAEVEEGIASLQAKYEECIAKKQELEFKTKQCSDRLGRAEKVSLIKGYA